MNGGVISNVPGIRALSGANLDIAYSQPESMFIKSYATAGHVHVGFGGSVPLTVSGNLSSGGNMTASGQGFRRGDLQRRRSESAIRCCAAHLQGK